MSGVSGADAPGGVARGSFANTEPGPYAKAFREKFPVPEFPGIKKEES